MSQQDLETMCLLAKSAKGQAAAQLITQALEHPAIFVFGELIDCANIQAVSIAGALPEAAARPHPHKSEPSPVHPLADSRRSPSLP